MTLRTTTTDSSVRYVSKDDHRDGEQALHVSKWSDSKRNSGTQNGSNIKFSQKDEMFIKNTLGEMFTHLKRVLSCPL